MSKYVPSAGGFEFDAIAPPAASRLRSISMIGSYVPRRCGIATFTNDLAQSLALRAPSIQTRAVAMNDRPEGYRYPSRVWFEINEKRYGEYRLAADFLNLSRVDVVSLQHEFGLFGGECGRYILDLIDHLRMPVVTTLHTVLKEPNEHQLEVTKLLGQKCDRLVVMADRAFEFLRDIYGVPESKVKLIPHGIPEAPFVDPAFYKDQFGVEGRKVILTFGLLGPSKGIEFMVEALPKIVAKHPDVIYIVLGATHPGVIAHQGEEYRLGLQRRVAELGIEDNIRFVNKFVELEELKEFMGCADVYVTPYQNEAQITSGTLAYALGFGKAVVSTPYWHAAEMMAEGRGSLVKFDDHESVSDAINKLLDDDVARAQQRKKAYEYTRSMVWPNVAQQYLNLFAEVCEQRSQQTIPRSKMKPMDPAEAEELSEVKLDHLVRLTDDVGVMHRAKATVPDRNKGYRTDDNARALYAVTLAKHFLEDKTLDTTMLVSRYLAFLEHAWDSETKRFRMHMSYDRIWSDDPPSEDTHGRCIWALGEAVARAELEGHVQLASDLLHRAIEPVESFEHPRAWGYTLIGLHAYLRRFSGDSAVKRLREQLAHRLYDGFKDNESEDWHWPYDKVTYTPARIPHALLLSGRWMFNNEMIQCALRSLEWLHVIQTGPNGSFAPVGSHGWWIRGEEKARFDQRPNSVQAMLEACIEAWHVTGDKKWISRARRCRDWFLGDNDLHQPLYDATTGGCYDELFQHGVSPNQSAESTLSWLVSILHLYELKLETNPQLKAIPGEGSDPDAKPLPLQSETKATEALTV